MKFGSCFHSKNPCQEFAVQAAGSGSRRQLRVIGFFDGDVVCQWDSRDGNDVSYMFPLSGVCSVVFTSK